MTASDLLFQDEIRDAVGRAYRALDTGAGAAVANRFYSEAELARLPPDTVTWALGVANPLRRAELAPGEVVLDLGSGGGIDTILAAVRVGPTGAAIGVDLLEEMCARAGPGRLPPGSRTARCSTARRSNRSPWPTPPSTSSSRTASSTCRPARRGCSPRRTGCCGPGGGCASPT